MSWQSEKDQLFQSWPEMAGRNWTFRILAYCCTIAFNSLDKIFWIAFAFWNINRWNASAFPLLVLTSVGQAVSLMLGFYSHPGRTHRKCDEVGCMKRTNSSCYAGTYRTIGSTLCTILTPVGQTRDIKDGQGRSKVIDTAPAQTFWA